MQSARPATPPPHIPGSQLAQLATPTSSQTILTRLLHSQTPTYQIPPPVSLTPQQQDFLTNGFSTLPPSIDPTSTPCTDAHNAQRYTRKRQHITAILRHLLPILPDQPGHLIDACCGTAHVGLVLAYLLPAWRVTLLDRSPRALSIATKRASDAGLSNVVTSQGLVEDCLEHYDALVALHACGGASDACLASVVRNNAVACVIPCCTGGSVTQKGRVTGLSYAAKVGDPHYRGGLIEWTMARSDAYREILGRAEFDELARCGDGVEAQGKVAKTLLEHDRVLWLRECGRICGIGRLGGGIKDDVIVVGDVSDWAVDHVANGVVDDYLGLGDGVHGVVKVLKDVVVGRGEVYKAGGGRVARKRVHAAAEMLGLRHYSTGTGKDRVVIVMQGDGGDGRVYCRGSVGVRSRAIDEVGERLCKYVPKSFVDRRILVRGEGFHVTLFSPKEVRSLGQIEGILSEAEETLRGSVVKVVGVGKVKSGGLRGWDGVAVGEGLVQGEVFFVVLDWPAVQVMRQRYGLPEIDVHITLGFRDEDEHDVRKDATTIVHKIDQSFVWC